MDKPSSLARFWFLFAFLSLATVIVAAIFWSLAHPYGIHWDEAEYINQALVDTHRLQHGALYKLAGRILESGGRPSAYRILPLPFFGLFGFHTQLARLVTLACFGLSAWLLFLATRRIAGAVAGALAVLVFCLSPEVLAACSFFSTEGPLYLATSAMFYFLFRCWNDVPDRLANWFGLGLALGLGYLSKSSFIIISLPVLAFWLVEIFRRKLPVPGVASVCTAALLTSLIAGPWWFLNLKMAITSAHSAREFVRDSLGAPSVLTWVRWLNTVIQGLFGLGLSILIGLVLFGAIRKVISNGKGFLDPTQRVALGACVFAGAPIVLTQLSGVNHLLRHISPAVIPLAITVGALTVQLGWASSRGFIAASTALLCAQLLVIVAPVVFPSDHLVESGFVNGGLPWHALARLDQWDWQPVMEISDSCGLAAPRVSYLGGGRVFDLPHIEYPWMAKPASTGRIGFDSADVRRLWHYEEGALDWQKVMNSAWQSDLVLTAPHYIGELDNRENLDNQDNAEFAARLSRDARFRGPVRLQMGRFEPVEVDVFLNSALQCQSPRH